MSILSADIGSSYTNISYGKKGAKQAVIPTLVAEQPEATQSTIGYDGKFYACGDSAFAVLNERPAEPKITAGFHGSEDQKILLCSVFDRFDVTGELDFLVRSIPYSERTNKELIEKLKSQTHFEWIGRDGKKKSLTALQVNIIPQGIGAFRAWQHGVYNGGKPVDAQKKDIVLGEIGSCTFDIISLRFDEDIQDYAFVPECCTSNREINVHKFMNILREEIKRKAGGTGADFAYHKLSKLLINGETKINVTNAGEIETIDIGDAIQKAKAKFTPIIYDTLRAEAKSVFNDAGIVLIGGGGAELLVKDLWKDKRSYFLDNWGDSLGQLLQIEATVEEAAA